MKSHNRRAMAELVSSSLRGRRRQLLELAGWSLLEALPAFLGGRLVARALDHGFLAHRPSTGLAWLGVLGLAALVGAWGTRQAFLSLAALVEPVRDDLAARVVTASLRRSTVAGAMPDTAAVARLTQQVEIVREALASVLLVVQGFVVTAVSAIIGLSTLVPAAVLLVVPPLVAAVAMFVVVLIRMAGRQRASIVAEEEIAEATAAAATAVRDVIAGGAEDVVAARVGRHIDAQAAAAHDLARLTAVRTLAVALGAWLPIVLLLVFGSWLTGHGATTGAVVGALTYVLQGVYPALQTLVRGLGSNGLWLTVTMRRLVEVAEEDAEQPTGRAAARRAKGTPVRLENVTFAYGAGAVAVVEGLDLHIPEGDHLAVVGPSGVGKSTLANLITGMLMPRAGTVRLGGIKTTDLDAAELAARRALIPQEAYVFAGTVAENLDYLSQQVTLAEADRAIDELGMRPLLERIGGLAAVIDPRALSAGERQLITLVRAYLSPAPLVVLDEATCHLDPAAEAQVEAAFSARGGTLVVAAHRISSALRARRILLMDGSRITVGTDRELRLSSPLYRDLVGHWGPPAELVRAR